MPIMFEPPATAAKIVIVGAGAMGSIYAGLFAEAGHSGAVVDIWAEHISAITKAGLRLEGASGDRVVTNIQAFGTVEEAENLELPPFSRIAYLTQTTLSLDDTADIIKVLRRRFPEIEGPAKDDICYATQNRQNAVKQISKEVDLVLVVGAENSSNTLRLVEVAESLGTRAVRIQSSSELQPDLLEECNKIGITAGASAPEDIVQGIVDKLRGWNPGCRVRELKLTEEQVSFGLPPQLKTP